MPYPHIIADYNLTFSSGLIWMPEEHYCKGIC